MNAPVDAAFGQLIAGLDAEGVRRMMCPKSGGNPRECLSCDGIRTCLPGQQAVRLAAKPVYTRAWVETPKAAERRPKSMLPSPAGAARGSESQRESVKVSENPTGTDEHNKVILTPTQDSLNRELLQTACESGNAWNYLMETRGLSKDAAGELLSRLIKKYPGIAADYGGSRRIMQRPKVVKITSGSAQTKAEAPAAARVAPEAASGQEVEAVQALEAEAARGAENGGKARDGYRETMLEAIRQEYPAAWLMEKLGIDMRQAKKKIQNFKDRHPEDWRAARPKKSIHEMSDDEKREVLAECLAAKDPEAHYMEFFGIRTRLAAQAALKRWREKYGTPGAEDTRMAEQPGTESAAGLAEADAETEEADMTAEAGGDEGDEISLEDFLSEMGAFEEPEPTQNATEPGPDRPQAARRPADGQEAGQTAGSATEALRGKREAFRQEKEALREEIRKAEEKIRWIEEQEDALEKVISMFG